MKQFAFSLFQIAASVLMGAALAFFFIELRLNNASEANETLANNLTEKHQRLRKEIDTLQKRVLELEAVAVNASHPAASDSGIQEHYETDVAGKTEPANDSIIVSDAEPHDDVSHALAASQQQRESIINQFLDEDTDAYWSTYATSLVTDGLIQPENGRVEMLSGECRQTLCKFDLVAYQSDIEVTNLVDLLADNVFREISHWQVFKGDTVNHGESRFTMIGMR